VKMYESHHLNVFTVNCLISTPSIRTLPVNSSTILNIMFSRLDLPEPVLPTIPTTTWSITDYTTEYIMTYSGPRYDVQLT